MYLVAPAFKLYFNKLKKNDSLINIPKWINRNFALLPSENLAPVYETVYQMMKNYEVGYLPNNCINLFYPTEKSRLQHPTNLINTQICKWLLKAHKQGCV